MLPLLGATPYPPPHSKMADITGNYERIEGDEYNSVEICYLLLEVTGIIYSVRRCISMRGWWFWGQREGSKLKVPKTSGGGRTPARPTIPLKIVIFLVCTELFQLFISGCRNAIRRSNQNLFRNYFNKSIRPRRLPKHQRTQRFDITGREFFHFISQRPELLWRLWRQVGIKRLM